MAWAGCGRQQPFKHTSVLSKSVTSHRVPQAAVLNWGDQYRPARWHSSATLLVLRRSSGGAGGCGGAVRSRCGNAGSADPAVDACRRGPAAAVVRDGHIDGAVELARG